MSIPQKGVLMGVDFGEVRTGVAFSDYDQKFAFPNGIYGPKSKVTALLHDLIVEREVVGIVVGWPLNMKGEEAFQCKKTQLFIDELKKLWDGPIATFDERLSSLYVSSTYSAGMKLDTDDALSAMTILNSFMESRKYSL